VFTDQESVEAGGTEILKIGVGSQAGFGDGQAMVRDLFDQFEGRFHAHRQGFQVAIVDADDAGIRSEGAIEFAGDEVQDLSPNEVVRRGCIQVMQGRYCFGHLTIEENLLTGAFTRRDGSAAIRAELEKVYAYFPRLRERRQSLAGYTSGGEQQMCAIGRALMSHPKMILLDEPSMGLAPQIVEEIFTIMKSLNESEGVSFLLAEQNANLALKYSRYGYVLENGRVVLDGTAAALSENEDVKEFYLGVAEGERKSFRDGKHYKRRKRWLA